MPLHVIALAPDETDDLTLAEWDRLVGASRVHFDDPTHPLIDRLRRSGVDAVTEPPEDDGDGVLVTADAQRLRELARRGASISTGSAAPPDDLTAADGAYVARRAGRSMQRLALVMARLRGPDGCPWDREQTHESLRVHLIEEAHEVLDAIDRDLLGAELEEELGDVLLQVTFHAEIAGQDGRFDLAGIADRLVDKLVHRHPHVFADTAVADSAEVIRNWETLKGREKQRTGPFDDIPRSLPALLYAYKVQKRSAPLGFEASAARAADEIARRLGHDAEPESVGELLFWAVALARAAGVDPEGALRAAVIRFRDEIAPDAGIDDQT